MGDYHTLANMIRRAESVVFFGGAGVSTDSGIPDFRGTGGLYSGSHNDDASPSNILSRESLYNDPEHFYDFFRSEILNSSARPNEAHVALALLEQAGFIGTVITQNVDGLHQRAGSQNVIELHGSAHRYHCIGCGKKFTDAIIEQSAGVPHCNSCDGIVRPDIVLYGESVRGDVQTAAEEAVCYADLLIVGGTSLSVHSATAIVSCFEGEHLIIINEMKTQYDGLAEMLISDPIGEVLSEIAAELL